MNTTNQNDSNNTFSKHPVKNFVIGFFVILIFLIGHSLFAQVGVGTTNPQAALDIEASNTTNPANDDGILIPRVGNFPSSNPTASQDGMLIFYTGTGADGKGYYYWDNPTTSWIKIASGGKNTLDEAYDEGGAGAGRTITADNGSVRINGTDGFLVTGNFNSGNTIDTEITGAGTRLFFNPRKAAFRAGTATGNVWDNTNIGNYSIAMGYSPTASNSYAIALGLNTTASGAGSVALGREATASGANSVALGWDSSASGNSSLAFGYLSDASGLYSTAIGPLANATNSSATAIGNQTTASGSLSIALGYQTTASGTASTAFGYGTNSDGLASTTFGQSTSATGENSLAFGEDTSASAENSTAFGYLTVASGIGSTSFGYQNIASGVYSTTFGNSNTASDAYTLAFGYSNVASNIYTTAFGNSNNASGNSSTVFGSLNTASGAFSTASGFNNEARSGYETVIGSYSTTYSPTSTTGFNLNDRLFVVGNGTSPTNRSNALTIYKNGRMNINDEYNMPLTDGTNGDVMTTDGAGNVSFQAITAQNNSASNGLNEVGADIRLGGTLTQNTTITNGTNTFDINLNSTGDFAIQDAGTDVFFVEDTGDIGIGNSNPEYLLHVTENTATETRAVYIDKDDNTNASTQGIYVAKTSNGDGRNHGYFANVNGSGDGNRYGIYTDINGTGTGQKYGIFNELDSNTSGSQYAVRNWVRGESGSNQFGVFNNMDNANTADIYGVYNGMRVSNASNMYGVYNEFQTANSSTDLISGIRNRFTNGTPGTNGFSGIYTDFDLTANGIYYGVRNEYGAGSTGIGTKYGTYNLISSSAGGTHYGTYNSVNTANGWAGYFLGRNYISDRLSIGETNNNSAKLSINLNSAGGTSGIKHIELKEADADDGSRIYFTNTAETNNAWTVYGRADDTEADSRINFFFSNAPGNNNIMQIFGDNEVTINGRLGVNFNNPTYAIQLPNNATIGTGQGRANAWATYSDSRVKSSQQQLENGLALITKMTPKTYFHHNGNIEDGILNIKDSGEQTLGFIAQELYEVLPEAVQKPEDENQSLWSVNYDKIIPVTVKAIQELHTKIKALETENTSLKTKLNKLEQLEARILALENNNTINSTKNETASLIKE